MSAQSWKIQTINSVFWMGLGNAKFSVLTHTVWFKKLRLLHWAQFTIFLKNKEIFSVGEKCLESQEERLVTTEQRIWMSKQSRGYRSCERQRTIIIKYFSGDLGLWVLKDIRRTVEEVGQWPQNYSRLCEKGAKPKPESGQRNGFVFILLLRWGLEELFTADHEGASPESLYPLWQV